VLGERRLALIEDIGGGRDACSRAQLALVDLAIRRLRERASQHRVVHAAALLDDVNLHDGQRRCVG
jgi:hypothetical protein